MASSIDTTKPVSGSPTTQSVRDNFSAAKSEIEALQAGKADLAGPALTGTTTAVNLTVSGTLNADGTLQIGGSAVTATAAEINKLDGVTASTTEINYLVGLTGNIQTQIDNLSGSASWGNITGTLSNQTDLQSALNAKQATITGAATTIDTEDLTANRALLSSGAGKVAVSLVTSTELGYLDGVTSNIQTQLDAKSPKASPEFTGVVKIGADFSVEQDGTDLVFKHGATRIAKLSSTGFLTVATDAGKGTV